MPDPKFDSELQVVVPKLMRDRQEAEAQARHQKETKAAAFAEVEAKKAKEETGALDAVNAQAVARAAAAQQPLSDQSTPIGTPATTDLKKAIEEGIKITHNKDGKLRIEITGEAANQLENAGGAGLMRQTAEGLGFQVRDTARNEPPGIIISRNVAPVPGNSHVLTPSAPPLEGTERDYQQAREAYLLPQMHSVTVRTNHREFAVNAERQEELREFMSGLKVGSVFDAVMAEQKQRMYEWMGQQAAALRSNPV
jgi:hypothetical protein